MASSSISTLVSPTKFSFGLTARPRRTSSATTLLAAARPTSLLDHSALLQAAKHTVDMYIRNGMTVGLGAGQASAMAIQYLGQQLLAGNYRDITGIPTSVASASEAVQAGIPLDRYQESSKIDFAFDDADIVEEESLIAVIGRRQLQNGESIIQEKAILNTASDLAFIITEKKYKTGLDGAIPVLIQSINWMEVAEEIDDLFIGDAEVWRRSTTGDKGPSGGEFPLITREGHNVLDVIFTSPIQSLAEIAEKLEKVDGVVEHGVVSKPSCKAVIASTSGLRIVDR